MSTAARPARPRPTTASLDGRDDPRVLAFCSGSCPDIFHAVAHKHEVWLEDPFDVESIHVEARDVLQRLVDRATTPPGPDSGRILLLLGESGCGKTHLMRAFRNWSHDGGRAYCGYMQMTTATNDYGRYILNNLIDSLEHPYVETRGETSGLIRLSSAMVESVPGVPPEDLERLRQGEQDPESLARLVDEIADRLVMDDRYEKVDFDLARAMLYLQCGDRRIRPRILKYLRCEDLSPADRRFLGEIVPRTYDDAPLVLIEKLGGLMQATQSAAIVLCVDQLEEIYNQEGAGVRFRLAMAALRDLADRVPTSVVVIACLQDFYEKLKAHLTRPVVDRLEKSPAPVELKANRESGEVETLIARRLGHLYEIEEVRGVPDGETFPIPEQALAQLAGKRARDVLAWCDTYRERCIREGRLVPSEPVSDPGKGDEWGTEPDLLNVEQRWNDFRTTKVWDVPDDDEAQLDLLVWAIERCSDELPADAWFSAEANGLIASVDCHAPGDELNRLVVGLCNKAPQGGHLGRQITKLMLRASEQDPMITPVVVRSNNFPSSPTTQIGRQIGELITRGGRRVVVENTDWRTILALKAFREAHHADPALESWLNEERPLGQLKSLRTMLGLDRLAATPRPSVARQPELPLAEPDLVVATVPPREVPRVETVPASDETEQAVDESGPMVIGRGSDRAGLPVELDPEELTRHAAFLGGTGSGKTTLALNVVEQLLLRGIPALLIDRKGDLGGYADPDARPGTDAVPDLIARARRLRDRVDVGLYTPGNPAGRPLSISVAPEGLDGLPTHEREQVARYAAAALGGMLGYSQRGQDQSRLAILAKAIQTLGETRPAAPVTLEEVIGLIDEQDSGLIAAVGRLDTRLFGRLVQDLETLRMNRGALLDAAGERLDPEALLGLGAHSAPGRTRLSIVSTKFLGGNADIQFWVAQLLVELSRWASESPSDRLQAVVLFDEADLYLPAQGKPPTKEPMENLLRRARSAGLGILLATQSPGDLDYKCRDNIRTWLVGRVREPVALAKMRPMLAECRVDIESRLPGQGPGQFHLLRDGSVAGILAGRNALPALQRPEDQIELLARRPPGPKHPIPGDSRASGGPGI